MAHDDLRAPVTFDGEYLAAILERLEAQGEQVAALEWGVRAIVRLLAADREAVEAGKEAQEIAAWPGRRAKLREPAAPEPPAPATTSAKTAKRRKPKG